MLTRIAVIILLGCTPFQNFAQLRWSPDTSFGSLPPSIKVFKTTDSLDGKPFIAYYVKADLNDKKLEFSTQSGRGKRYTVSQYFNSESYPSVVVNGTFFSFQTNQNLNILVNKKKLLSYNVTALKLRGKDTGWYYYPTRSAIGISKKRKADVAWIFTDSAKKWAYAFEDSPVVAKGKDSIPSLDRLKRYDWRKWKMVTAIGGGPVLIHNGQLKVTNREEQMFVSGLKDKHPRTAMGYTADNKLIILLIEGRNPGVAEGADLEQEAKILLDLGCYEALNLDGGGSSAMIVNGKQTIKPSDKEGERPVPGVFMIRRRN